METISWLSATELAPLLALTHKAGLPTDQTLALVVAALHAWCSILSLCRITVLVRGSHAPQRMKPVAVSVPNLLGYPFTQTEIDTVLAPHADVLRWLKAGGPKGALLDKVRVGLPAFEMKDLRSALLRFEFLRVQEFVTAVIEAHYERASAAVEAFIDAGLARRAGRPGQRRPTDGIAWPIATIPKMDPAQIEKLLVLAALYQFALSMCTRVARWPVLTDIQEIERRDHFRAMLVRHYPEAAAFLEAMPIARRLALRMNKVSSFGKTLPAAELFSQRNAAVRFVQDKLTTD